MKSGAITNGDNNVDEAAKPDDRGTSKDRGSSKGQSRPPSRPESVARGASNPPPPPAPAPAPAKKEPRDARMLINFPTKLSNRVVSAGSKVRLTCYLEGADPGIRWYKDDQPIVYSAKCRQNNLNGLCTLELASVTLADSGTYKCYARNNSGEASTSATLEVYSSGDSADLSPTFTRSLKESYNSKINEINITCHVRAIPKAEITWVKDGVTIEPSDKYQLTELDDGVCELNISDATKQDNGKYVCKAENRAGETDTMHIVQLEIREQRTSITSLSSLRDRPPTPMSENEDDKDAGSLAGSIAGSAAGSVSSRAPRPPKREAPPPSGGGRRYAPLPPPDPKQNLFFLGKVNGPHFSISLTFTWKRLQIFTTSTRF